MINIVIKRLAIMIMIILGIAVIGAPHAYAVDPPHRTTDATDTWWCTNCHSLYGVGTALKTPKGNSARCLTCHNPAIGSLAINKPFLEAEEAVPGTSGIYHRWDSGPGGYVPPTEAHTSSGNILSGVTVTAGVPQPFSGTSPRTYKITIVNPGDVSAATFNCDYLDDGNTLWTSCGSNVAAGQDVSLGNNIKITFVNGLSPSFKAGDIWNIKVRPQINYPTTYIDDYANLTKKMFPDTGAPNDIPDVDPTTYTYPASTYGKASCSTCHNQHYQTYGSNDPFSPSTYDNTVPFSDGAGRHYQRIPNQENGLCLDCHSARNIGNDFTTQGKNVRTYNNGNKLSHPVGVDLSSLNTPMHLVPKEPGGTDQSAKTTSGKATSTTSETCVTDSNKTWNISNDPTGLYVYFPKSGNSKPIISYDNITHKICWASGALTITSGDAYVIDADGNPTNNLRLYDTTLGPNFTTGKVYCLTCHGIHWADSDQTTYDQGN